MRPLLASASVAAIAATGLALSACGDAPEDAPHAQSGPTTARAELRPANDANVRAASFRSDPDDTVDIVPDGVVSSVPDVPAEPVDLAVEIGAQPVPFEVWHELVMPGETIEISANAPISVRVDGRRVGDNANTHEWTAPRTPGVHDMRVEGSDGVEHRVSVFVLQPYSGQEVLDGYRIGTYPENAPEGFIRLGQDDMDTPVSPGFTIGQFICKQQPGHWPKFLLVSGDMLRRLEAVLTELNEDGLTDADTFFVMSGYRTPFYNTEIRSARLSRHMYGDAADIYPDVEGNDSVMDDLNNDGRITRADAEFLYDYAEDLFQRRADLPDGGIGAYDANAVHGPFVHIDGRGHRARWGRYGS